MDVETYLIKDAGVGKYIRIYMYVYAREQHLVERIRSKEIDTAAMIVLEWYREVVQQLCSSSSRILRSRDVFEDVGVKYNR